MTLRRVTNLFGKGKHRGGRGRSRGRDRVSMPRLPESLEQRIAMTVAHQVGVGPFLTGAPTWATIYSDGGDDIYTSVVAPAAVGQTGTAPALIYADNASFLGYTAIGGATYAAVDNVYVTNGTLALNTNLWQIGGELVGGPVQEADSYPLVAGSTSRFVLPSEEVDLDSDAGIAVSGTLRNGVGGVWTFTNGGSGNVFLFTSVTVPTGPLPLSAAVRLRATTGSTSWTGPSDAVFEVTWDSSLVGGGGFDVQSPPSIDIEYDREDDGGFTYTSAQAEASSAAQPRFSLPIPAGIPVSPAGYQVVPGTLVGTIYIQRELGGAVTAIPFTQNGIFDTPTTSPNELVFELGLTAGTQFDDEGFFRTTGFLGNDDRFIRGRIGSGIDSNGTVVPTLDFVFEGVDGGRRFLQEVGRVSVVATYAIYNQPEKFKGGNYTLYDGLDFTKSLTVDLLAPGSTTTVESYIDGEFADFHSSNLIVNAPTLVDESFTVSNSRVGEAVAEQVFVNANVGADTFDIRVSDDPGTDAVQRSRVFVSTTGSLGRTLPTTPASVPSPASSVHVEAGYGDVIVEGLVIARDQSYIVNSAAEFDLDDPADTFGVNHRGPYYVTTRAPISGANTGRLIGTNVAILLGNDVPTIYDDVSNGGAHSLNIVDIRTDVDSIRVQAADRKLNPIQTPFPYDLTIEELNKIRIDAVAASSRPISITAAGDVEFHANVVSASDVTVNSSAGNLWLNAPLSTQFGTISLEANQLTIGNSVRVFDAYYDDTLTDIVLRARNGDLQLTGPISAVNMIELRQDVGSRIYGDARVIADRLAIDAIGSVTLRTDVRQLSGRVEGAVSIDELNDIEVVGLECLNGTVSIVASGRDLPAPRADGTTAALRATLPDARILTVSAPQGSVSVTVSSATTLSVGDAGPIVRGTATPMLAAGGVLIETEAASIDVYDAPVSGASAFLVRVATVENENLDGVYAQRTPGTFPSTLTGKVPGSLNMEGIDGIKTLAARDLILVKNQGNPNENGIYQIVDIGSATRPWVLARSSAFDTTAELTVNSFFRVSEGVINSAAVFQLQEYENVVGETPKRVATILNRSRSFSDAAYIRGDADLGQVPDERLDPREVAPVEVRAVSTTTLSAYYEYDEASGKSYVSSITDEPIPLFDGVSLKAGDYVLVRMGTKDPSGLITNVSNGVYVVVSAGSNVATWTLESVDSSAFDTGMVVPVEGSLRTSATGNVFNVAYNSLGRSAATFRQADAATLIGSRDLNDVVRFIVSSKGGVNTGVGTLGKMISLSNQNAYKVPVDGGFGDSDPEDDQPQQQAVVFGASIGGAINLTQELPAITRTVTIDATASRVALGGVSAVSQIVINGSRIVTLANGKSALSVPEVGGLRVYGSAADGTKISGIRMGGFSKGAAVQLDGVNGVQVSEMEFGLDILGRRSANKYGIEVSPDIDPVAPGIQLGSGVGGHTTVSGSKIYSSSVAGVMVRNAVDSIRLVGNTIGARGFENAVGVDFTNGTNFLGLVTQTTLLRRVSATRESDTTFSLPATYSSLAAMYVGLGVGGERIKADEGYASARISAISQVGTNGRVTFTIEHGVILMPVPSAPVLLDFGAYVDLEAGSKTTTVPTGVFGNELYIGQIVTGAGLPAGTRIVSIQPGDGSTPGIMTLSNAATASGPVAVGLEAVARNAVAYNTRGVILRGGASRIVNTDISNSVFDGVRVVGTAEATYAIGGLDGRTGVDGRPMAKDLTLSSNAIFANGSAGIRVGAAVQPNQITIQGNRLGVTSANVSGRNVAGNIVGLGIGVTGEPIALGTMTSLAAPKPSPAWANTGYVVMNDHGLNDGDIVFLKITAPGGAVTEAAFEVSRDSSYRFAIKLPSGFPTSGTVECFRYGSTATRQRASQLVATKQRDFEGNLHGPVSSRDPLPGGNTISRPIIRPWQVR
jgi:hypothetical protein